MIGSHQAPVNPDSSADSPPRRGGELLALAFAMSTGMWAIGYVCRLPFLQLPPVLLLALLVSILLAGGFVAGRYTTLRQAMGAGALCGVINLLSLLSVLRHGEKGLVDLAWLWIPVFILLSSLLALIGAVLGRLRRTAVAPMVWPAALAWVGVLATLTLIAAGGMVTGFQEGMAVPDWPRSFGVNMFLYPLSRMTGGIYYEHTHRLLGTLVGLVVLVQAIYLGLAERRGWIRALGLVVLTMVCLQGFLGGIRVTRSDVTLAMIHGIVGQMFLGMQVSLAVVLSSGRQESAGEDKPLSTDLFLNLMLVGLIWVQLILGAALRHRGWGLLAHITMASMVFLLTLTSSFRAWGLYERPRMIPRLGIFMASSALLQVILGTLALVVLGGAAPPKQPTTLQALITTLHQVNGALMLVGAVMLACWFGLCWKKESHPEGARK